MAYIDPEGMFGGDRMALLSDEAKLAFPWFWCASNTLGRVELNYRQFTSGPFRQFRKPPTETQFWGWVTEFHQSFLMFAYQESGRAWGQWDTSERYLPAYKTVADRRTPAPNSGEFLKWRNAYQEQKSASLSSKCSVLNISENFQKLPESSENFPIGRGIGIGEIQPPSPPAGGFSKKGKPAPRAGRKTEEQLRRELGAEGERWWEEFWKIYPCHEGKRPAMETFLRVVTTRDVAVEVFRGAKKYSERAASDPDMKLKYAQGWLNDERWKDEYVVRAEQPYNGTRYTRVP